MIPSLPPKFSLMTHASWFSFSYPPASQPGCVAAEKHTLHLPTWSFRSASIPAGAVWTLKDTSRATPGEFLRLRLASDWCSPLRGACPPSGSFGTLTYLRQEESGTCADGLALPAGGTFDGEGPEGEPYPAEVRPEYESDLKSELGLRKLPGFPAAWERFTSGGRVPRTDVPVDFTELLLCIVGERLGEVKFFKFLVSERN
mmetsp:Transcript_2371/g.5601  ORF Transcript_2371/g.5601 Transcript_2371/m.5601 type:complete len:201 (-) Transcript_2371:446-1048(-)